METMNAKPCQHKWRHSFTGWHCELCHENGGDGTVPYEASFQEIFNAMNTPPEPTPRTDAEATRIYNDEKQYEESSDVAIAAFNFARTLERELAQEHERRCVAESQVENADINLAQVKMIFEDKLAQANARIAELEVALSVIGDLAVIDFDDPTVGKVDAAVPFKKALTYKDLLKEIMQENPQKLKEAQGQLTALRADAQTLVEALQAWQHAHRNTDSEYDYCRPAFKQARYALSTFLAKHGETPPCEQHPSIARYMVEEEGKT